MCTLAAQRILGPCPDDTTEHYPRRDAQTRLSWKEHPLISPSNIRVNEYRRQDPLAALRNPGVGRVVEA
jgi:hypothetical protein